MAEYNWEKMKKEYITTDISYRDLAKKHHAPQSSLFKRGKKENWGELRAQSRSREVAKGVEKSEEAKNFIYQIALSMAKSLSDIASKDAFTLAEVGLKPRDITLAAKDVQDLLHIKSDIDVREQEARIANLRKQAEAAENQDKEITVTIAGDLEKYAK